MSEAHRVHLGLRDYRVRMELQEHQASLSRVNQVTQDRRVFRVLLDYQVLGGPKEKKAVQDLRVIEALMDSVFQDHLGFLDLPDLVLIYRICSTLQRVSSTSQRSEDYQGQWALKVCPAELDFQAPEDLKET